MKDIALKIDRTDDIRETNLYDLIQAVSEEVEPGEEALITETVQHLFDTGKVKFVDCSSEFCNGL